MSKIIDKGEFEALIRRQLSTVATVARLGGDLTATYNAATAAILAAAGMPNAASAADRGIKAPLHYAVPCALDKPHECRTPVACNVTCTAGRSRRTTTDPALVTCGRCLKSDYVVAAA